MLDTITFCAAILTHWLSNTLYAINWDVSATIHILGHRFNFQKKYLNIFNTHHISLCYVKRLEKCTSQPGIYEPYRGHRELYYVKRIMDGEIKHQPNVHGSSYYCFSFAKILSPRDLFSCCSGAFVHITWSVIRELYMFKFLCFSLLYCNYI